MPRDLFAEKFKSNSSQPRDLFAEQGISIPDILEKNEPSNTIPTMIGDVPKNYQSFPTDESFFPNLKRFGKNAVDVGKFGRDVLGGVASTGQKLSNLLTGGRSTQYDFSSPDTNPIAKTLGEYAPGSIVAGPSILGQMGLAGALGYANAKPDEKNLLNLLPEGKAGAAIENALLAGIPMGIGKLGSTAFKALRKINPKETAKSIQFSHDMAKREASDLFNNVGNEVINRNIETFPLRENLISEIAETLPKTKKYKSLLQKAQSGDYQGIRDLQADLYEKGTKALKSPLKADNHEGHLMLELRDELNDSIINQFKNMGHIDLAKDLTKAKYIYKNLQNTYFHKKTPLVIKNLVDPESRKIPKNIFEVLEEESKPMERVKKANPFAIQQLKNAQEQEKARSFFKKGSLGGLIGLGGYGALDILERAKNYLSNRNE